MQIVFLAVKMCPQVFFPRHPQTARLYRDRLEITVDRPLRDARDDEKRGGYWRFSLFSERRKSNNTTAALFAGKTRAICDKSDRSVITIGFTRQSTVWWCVEYTRVRISNIVINRAHVRWYANKLMITRRAHRTIWTQKCMIYYVHLSVRSKTFKVCGWNLEAWENLYSRLVFKEKL